ncbi:glycosyltransferase [Sanguibacteroides justesenii]|uniref:Glycosyl transferase family 2 n=2 Tax=Sanguibacteroides TaxID=1635148 RepID=A0A0C3NK33_9PORP|nr:glycosyltransferase [Sanguibacteroides justesenii]KIO46572.1 glycosyl transferase family 2 [Sanguibacteroides justesenii]PXZ43702.1 glycosyltransferase [Sanguibacteroides justesenii]
MENLRIIWEGYGFYGYVAIFLLFLWGIHLFYVIYKSTSVLRKDKKRVGGSKEGVSVIIVSHNNAEFLKRNLPSFLMQFYENYEVIVVDECSEDDTQDVLAEIQKAYPQLRYTRIFPDTKFRFTKKLAINIGILAAKHDILLFSESYCRPASSFWVRTMQSYFDKDTAVVLGFSNYIEDGPGIMKRRCFRLLRFLKMCFLVKSKKYILGDGCNMAYRKSYYIKNRGFTGNSQSYLGYDNDMVRELSKFGKVRVVKDPNSYMIVDENDKKGGVDEISYYFASKFKWPIALRAQVEGDEIVRILFYGLSFCFIIMGVFEEYLLILVLLTFLLDFILLNIYSKHLKQRKLFLTSLVVSTVGFAYRWYWNGYSFFNRKKWR